MFCAIAYHAEQIWQLILKLINCLRNMSRAPKAWPKDDLPDGWKDKQTETMLKQYVSQFHGLRHNTDYLVRKI